MEPDMLPSSTRPTRSVACSFRAYPDAELLVVIDHRTGDYLVFEGAAANIWEAIDGVRTEEGIVQRVAADYGIAAADVQSDVCAFLGQLRDLRLLADTAPAALRAHGGQVAGVAASEDDKLAETSVRQWAYEQLVPYEGTFELTNRCNERCVHCYLRDKSGRGELRLNEVCRILDELAKLGCLRLTFTGGEIFTHRYVLDILNYACRTCHFYVSLLSNATRIDSQLAASLAELGVRDVGVSLYSADPDEHDRVTGRPGSHRRTLRGVVALRNAGIEVTVNCPITTRTAHVAPGIVALALALDSGYSFDPYLIPARGAARRAHELALSHDELVDVLREVADASGTPVRLLAKTARYQCNAGRPTFCIGSTGDLYPCLDLRVSAGSCRDRPVWDIWHEGPILEELRGTMKLFGNYLIDLDPTYVRPGHHLDHLRGRRSFRKASMPSRLTHCTSCPLHASCPRCFARAYHDDGDLFGCSSHARLQAQVGTQLGDEP